LDQISKPTDLSDIEVSDVFHQYRETSNS